MRISGNSNADVTATISKTVSAPVTSDVSKSVKHGGETPRLQEKVDVLELSSTTSSTNVSPVDNSEETKKKVQEAVETMNEVLVANDSASRFHYHEGLDRYYVTVVDKNTDEVVKEIPPKKLLDAFYEMQKMVGMIVDEKI